MRKFWFLLFAIVMVMFTFNLSAAPLTMPIYEGFNMDFPSTNIWARYSSPDGRMQIVVDEDKAPVSENVGSIKDPLSFSVANTFIGNAFTCKDDAYLFDYDMPLTPSAKGNVFFMVYKKDKFGTYRVVYSNRVYAPNSATYVNSGSINLTLQGGNSYIMGVGWTNSTTAFYTYKGHPDLLQFGWTTTGMTFAASVPPSSFSTFTGNQNAFLQRINTSREGVLRMDSSVNGSMVTNAITAQIDLAGYGAAYLEFRHRENGDESDALDGVFMSTNGTTWARIVRIDTNDTDWHFVSTNLVLAAAAVGITPTTQTWIRIQQRDNYPWNGSSVDGREFDDITIYAKADLDYHAIELPGYSSALKPLHLKGTTNSHSIPISSTIIWRGATNDLDQTQMTYHYIDGGTDVLQQENTWNCSLSALTTSTSTVSRAFTVPAGFLLTNLYALIHGVVDSDSAFEEDSELNNTGSVFAVINNYSGQLHFNNITTEITITNTLPRVFLSATDHSISGSGTWQGYPFTFVDLPVIKDLNNLDYSIDPAASDIVYVPITDERTMGGIFYTFTNDVELSTAGAHADIRVQLPAGMGVTMDPNARIFESHLNYPSTRLYNTLIPYNNSLSGSYYFFEETKPLRYEISQIYWSASGTYFALYPGNVDYVRDNECIKLETMDPTSAKKSNEGYYRSVTTSAYASVTYSYSAQAQLSSRVTLGPGTNTAHFPYGVTNSWSNGKLSFTRDQYNPGSSCISNAPDFDVYYSRNCPDENCGGSVSDAAIRVTPNSSALTISAQGGLHSEGSLNNKVIIWGAIDSSTFAYKTEPFHDGNYFMPGHFVRGTDLVFEDDPGHEPGSLMLSGIMTNDLQDYERHGTDAELDGYADYAGVNLRVNTDGAKEATSIFGKSTEASFPLSGRSKLYARASGISGIYESQAGQFPSDEMSVYGYPFEFSNYGLSFLSSENEESRTEGSTSLPFPSDITLEFEEMTFTCLGDLDDAQIPEGVGELHLSYWNAQFEPYTLQFRPADETDCSDTSRYLLLGIRTYCANIDPQLFGVIGFITNGNFIPPSFGHNDTDSRLTVPSSLQLTGPREEAYTFYPVSGAYFNNYEAEIDDLNYGFINIAGTMDVPFFDNLMVQLQTSASTNSANAPVYLMGGWPTTGWVDSNGQSFFDPITFDENNDGFPTSDLTLAEYRSGEDTNYLPRAVRSWLSVVEFDYPLDYDTSSRSFESYQPVQNDLMVLSVEHQIDYLSAENAEISFGIQYDGLPQINLANMVFEAVDEATGGTSEIFSGALDQLFEPILDGIDSLDTMLATLPQDAFGNVVDGLVDPVVEELYVQLTNSYHLDPSNFYSNNIDELVSGIGAGDSFNINARFGFLIEGNATVDFNLTDQLLDNLERVENLIDLFNTNATIDGESVTGLLHVNGSGEYPMLEELAGNLLLSLAAEYIDIFGAELEPTIQSLLAEINTPLQTISENLSELRPIVTNLQYTLNASNKLDFYQELSAQVDTTEINQVCTNAAEEIKAFFDNLPEISASFDDYTEDEIKAMIKQAITDQFYGSAIPTGISQVLRQRVYDLDSAIRKSCDSVFDSVNSTLRDMLSDYLADLDESINGCLGDVSDYIGAGQIDGYAHINGDSLTELRLDGAFQWSVPDELEFRGYLIIRQIDSDSPASCGGGSDPANEVILGTEGFGINWISEIKADIETKFSFKSDPFVPAGLAGKFVMVEGTIGFETFAITEFSAAAGFGMYENYISAAARAEFGSYEVAGGAFFGRTCSIDPIEMWDPEVADVLGDPPFTGIYVYGEGWMPIVDYTCLFRIKAGVGAGIFMFAEGPTVGGKIMLGASGEALCAVSVEGEIKMAGSKSGDDLRMAGSGRVSGRAGKCPFCVKYSKTIEFTYLNGDFEADY